MAKRFQSVFNFGLRNYFVIVMNWLDKKRHAKAGSRDWSKPHWELGVTYWKIYSCSKVSYVLQFEILLSTILLQFPIYTFKYFALV